jgi:fused signal recognition particle receptor
VIADTAGRLPTQANLMLELQKIKRVIQKAGINTPSTPAPHQIVVVLDGNTGQNALAQAKAFDACLGLTGIVITKLDGTAKGGILAAIALWVRELDALVVSGQRVTTPKVYFVGVGERLEDLQAFNADQFSQALLS